MRDFVNQPCHAVNALNSFRLFPWMRAHGIPRRAACAPILPILTYSDLSEVVNLIIRRARSLAGYIFRRDPGDD